MKTRQSIIEAATTAASVYDPSTHLPVILAIEDLLILRQQPGLPERIYRAIDAALIGGVA
jgi:hypothetical protein